MANTQAQNAGQQVPANESAADWDEEGLEKALAHLKDLHIKLRELRGTIPKLKEPFSKTPYGSPNALFASCQAAMMTAHRDVSEFKEQITSPEAKKVLEYAEQSRNKDPKSIKPWRARDHPDWAIPSS